MSRRGGRQSRRGVGNNGPFRPTLLSGCVLWLRADRGVTKDGSNNVSAWKDQSSAGNNASQATGAKQPLWVNAGSPGLPVIRFAASTHILSGALAHTGTTLTAFVVANRVTQVTNGSPLDLTKGANDFADNDSTYFNENDATNDGVWRNGSSVVTFAHPATGTFGVWSMVHDGVNVTARLNGVSQGLGASAGAFGISKYLINGRSVGGGVETALGNYEIGEAIVYSRNLNAAELSRVDKYLRSAWRTP